MTNILKTLIIFIGLLGFILTVPPEAYTQDKKKEEKRNKSPNIVLVLCDDLGYGDLSITGSNLIKTPNIDNMAKEGVQFTNFYSSASVCTPSRAGLLTGRYPIRTGLDIGVITPACEYGLPQEEITIGEALKDLGYRTAIIGKWHLGHTEDFWPTKQGFDYYYGLPYSNDMRPLALYQGTKKIEEPVNQSTLTERYTKQAIHFIKENKDRPFFVFLSHTSPHIPLYTSRRFTGISEAGLYGDVVETIDWSMGELLATLKRMGIDDKTLVIFTSDNGPWFEGSTNGSHGRKATAWEGGFHVPFIARWPGHIPKGKTSDAISMNIDLFPTLVELAGGQIQANHPIDGRNMWPLLQGGNESPHDCLYYFHNAELCAVRTQDWKLVVHGKYTSVPDVRTFLNGNIIGRWIAKGICPGLKEAETIAPWDKYKYWQYWLLFNIKRDPEENYSLARNNPKVLEHMKKLIYKGREEFAEQAKENMLPNIKKGGGPKPSKD